MWRFHKVVSEWFLRYPKTKKTNSSPKSSFFTLVEWLRFVLLRACVTSLYLCYRFTWELVLSFSQSPFSNFDYSKQYSWISFVITLSASSSSACNVNVTDSFSLEEATKDSGSKSESRKHSFSYLTPLWIVMLAVAVPTTVFMIWRATKKCKCRYFYGYK